MPDTNGLPDVKGLEDFVRSTVPDLQDKGTVATTPKPDAQQNAQSQNQPPAEELDLAQFKNPKDMLKSYKEIQGAFTRVAQENKTFTERENALKAEVQAMREQMEMISLQNQRQPVQQPTQDFDEMFIQNPRQAVEVLADRKATEKVMQARVMEVLEEENIKNPSEFNERYQYVQALSRQYPQLVTSAPGVRKLFQMADKFRVDDVKKNAARAISSLFGTEVDMEKLKVLLQKAPANSNNPNLAYMPDSGGTVSRSGSEPANVNFDQKISEAVGKGDVDSVLSGLFQKQLMT